MDVNRNNGQPPVDGHNLPAQADGAIAPPAQQMNQQLPARTVLMFNMLNTLGQFGGTPNENARHHLKSFLEICNSLKIHGVSNDVLKLKLFPYSLRDKAKTWLNNLQPGLLQSWTQLCRSFLAKFSYTNMTDHLRNQITSFRQEDDEAMNEAWERYRDLFRRCPMHGLPEWTQVSIFYNSVNTPTRMMLDASANGTLLDKPPRESLEILDKLAQNDYQHPTSRRGNTRRGPAQLDSSDTILAQIASLTNMVKNMQKQPHIQEVKALDAFCNQCGSNHDASECGEQVESSCYVGNYNRNAMPIGGFPSDTKVAKGATHEQCNAITTRSGKILKNNKGGMAANPSPAPDTPVEADEPAQASYNQIAIAPEDQSKTTFTCPYGTFAFRRMSFGLCNTLATFQRCMTAIFSNLNEDCLEIFMDDFSTFEDNFDNYLSNLEKDKLNGINFLDWFRNLRIVLKQERKEYVIEEVVPNYPGANAPRADKDKFKKHMDDMLDVGCLMLATMTPELQKQHEDMIAYEMIQNLKEIYEGQARQERYETSKALFQCKMSEGSPVGAHVIKMMGYIQTLEKLGFALNDELAIDVVLQSLVAFRSLSSYLI
ncbi:hypothetical protein GQ457_17G007610 [Hibiscus cannabinus]